MPILRNTISSYTMYDVVSECAKNSRFWQKIIDGFRFSAEIWAVFRFLAEIWAVFRYWVHPSVPPPCRVNEYLCYKLVFYSHFFIS